MIIFPAIDIKNGCCVRLYKGDFSTAEQVAADPLRTALDFRQAGAVWLHMVDLDGALAGKPMNRDLFVRIAKESGLKVQLGGGIRNMNTLDFYLSAGIERVILGSAALKSPDFVREAVKNYGGHIAVGIDARDGRVATEGWTDTSGVSYLEFAKIMESAGVRTIIFTDIARDGMLSGPALPQLKVLAQSVSCRMIASGGIKEIKDIESLTSLSLYGAICGRSLYSGTLNLTEAIRKAGNQNAG